MKLDMVTRSLPVSDWEAVSFDWGSASGITMEPVIVYRGQVFPAGIYFKGALPFYTWWLIEEGTLNLTVNEESVTLGAGQWVFIPFGMQREQQFTPKTRLVSVSFLAQWRENQPMLACPGMLVGSKTMAPEVCAAAEAIYDWIDETGREGGAAFQRKPMSLERAVGFKVSVLQFISRLFGYATHHGASIKRFEPGDSRLDWVLNDIRTRLRIGPLPFAEWEKETGLGRSQLDRIARRHLMMSLHAYRDQLLLEAVCQALRSRQWLVKQLAEAFGFFDTAHFSRWLRGRIGQSPTEYLDSPHPH